MTDGLPVDNNWIENQIRPIARGRNNWLPTHKASRIEELLPHRWQPNAAA